MKKQFKRSIKNRYRMMGEDLRILQNMVKNKSVYKKYDKAYYDKPKHPKAFMEYIETY